MEITQISFSNYRGFVRAEINAQTIQKALASFENGSELIKKGSRTRVVAVSASPNLVLKGYEKKTFFARWRTCLGAGRARRAWKHGLLLIKAGIPSAKPVAMLEGERWDILICEKIEGEYPNEKDSVQLRELLKQIHAAGWRARDLKRENLLKTKMPIQGQQFFLVDFDGIRRLRSAKQREQDLARLERWI